VAFFYARAAPAAHASISAMGGNETARGDQRDGSRDAARGSQRHWA